MAIVWVFAMVRVDPTLSTLTIESARSPTHEKNSLLAESESNSVSEGRQMLTCLRLSPVQLAAGQYRDPPDTPDPPPPEIWIGSYRCIRCIRCIVSDRIGCIDRALYPIHTLGRECQQLAESRDYAGPTWVSNQSENYARQHVHSELLSAVHSSPVSDAALVPSCPARSSLPPSGWTSNECSS